MRRLLHLADGGLAPHRVLLLSAQEGLRARIEAALERPHEELAVQTASALLRRRCSPPRRGAPASTRFVDVVSAADRLAMLLERADELELRHHDFRGRPLALFAGFIRHIDRLRAELIDAPRYAAWAERQRRAPRASASASSPPSSPPTTACSRSAASSTRAACSPPAWRCSPATPALRARVAAAHPAVLVDDWQDRTRGERELVAALEAGGSALTVAGDDDQAVGRARGAGAAGLERFAARAPRRARRAR